MATKTRKIHRVKAGAVVVTVGDAERYLYRGARVPEGADDKQVKDLTALGLLEVVEQEVEDTGDGSPTKPNGNAGFDKQLAWAQHLGIEVPADVVDAKDRDAVKALIEAHEAN
jgi:hypothetical protein